MSYTAAAVTAHPFDPAETPGNYASCAQCSAVAEHPHRAPGHPSQVRQHARVDGVDQVWEVDLAAWGRQHNH